MRSLETWLAQYAISHQHPANRIIHKICVPAIFLSLVGLLSLLRWPSFTNNVFLSAATVVGIASLVFYFTLGWPAFLKMLFLEVSALLFFSWLEPHLHHAALWYSLIFAVAWVGQFIGHEIEGKKPSFFQDLQFLLIGPLWVFRGIGR